MPRNPAQHLNNYTQHPDGLSYATFSPSPISTPNPHKPPHNSHRNLPHRHPIPLPLQPQTATSPLRTWPGRRVV
ncbi:hypothetical protein EX30DRAFT_339386 [Ascodesmis nigricans]|uniref:Uncharacterized protein n=1 Tax=Ascodesmis nigricans TaxID=341454 RepID=A0A4S2N200_9PEZI|nr:hypothetical protein EX30DRAFT_339386 [Ascodesmis nigricans]